MARKNENPVLIKLLDHLKQNGIEKADVLEYFKQTEKNVFSRRELRSTIKNPFPIGFVQRMVMATGVDPDIFNPEHFTIQGKAWSKAEHKKWLAEEQKEGSKNAYYFKDSQIFNKWSPQHHIREVINLKYAPDGTKKTRKEYTDKYTNAILPYIKDGAKSIKIVEYLAKDYSNEHKRYAENLEPYQDAHRNIFSTILTKFYGRKDFKYTRILTLPYKMAKSRNGEFKPTTELTILALQYCSLATYEHIYACLNLFETDQVSVAIAPTVRPVNFGIIEYEDKPNIIVCEHYKKENQVLVPDVLLVIESPTQWESPTNTLYKLYNREVIEHTKKPLGNVKTNTAILKANSLQIKNFTLTAHNLAEKEKDGAMIKSMNAKVAYMNNFEETKKKIIRQILAKRNIS